MTEAQQLWMNASAAQQHIRQQLNRNDIRIRPSDLLMSSEEYCLYKINPRTGPLGNAIDLTVLPEHVLTAKIFQGFEGNEEMFKERMKYAIVEEKMDVDPDVWVERPIPTVITEVVGNIPGNPHPTIVTAAPCHIPLSLLMRDNPVESFHAPFVFNLLMQCFISIRTIHDADYIHGDITPSDILISYTPTNRAPNDLMQPSNGSTAHPFLGHDALQQDDFTVVFQNLERVTEYRYRITNLAAKKRHIRFTNIADLSDCDHSTYLYSSPSRNVAGNRNPLSRKSDLLSLMYILAEVVNGDLPWRAEFLSRPWNKQFWTELSQRKRDCTAQQLFGHGQGPIQAIIRETFVDIVENITFSSDPLHNALQAALQGTGN